MAATGPTQCAWLGSHVCVCVCVRVCACAHTGINRHATQADRMKEKRCPGAASVTSPKSVHEDSWSCLFRADPSGNPQEEKS